MNAAWALSLIPLPALVLVAAMVALSFSGQAPARVSLVGDRVVVTMRGPMPLFALRRQLSIDVATITSVHADHFAKNLLGGFRVGAHLPKVMTAGYYYRGRGRSWDFFAVYRARSALVLDLAPGRWLRRVIVEIDDLEATAAAIEDARAPAR